MRHCKYLENSLNDVRKQLYKCTPVHGDTGFLLPLFTLSLVFFCKLLLDFSFFNVYAASVQTLIIFNSFCKLNNFIVKTFYSLEAIIHNFKVTDEARYT